MTSTLCLKPLVGVPVDGHLPSATRRRDSAIRINFLFQTGDDVAEFLKIERLGHDLVDCQFLICPDVVRREMGGKDNDSTIIVALSKFPHQLQPAGARHPVIGDYD